MGTSTACASGYDVGRLSQHNDKGGPVMYRVFLTALLLATIPVAFSQSASPKHILIKANCALPDGTVLAHKLIEVDASLSAEKKRAVAEQACRPILDDATAKC